MYEFNIVHFSCRNYYYIIMYLLLLCYVHGWDDVVMWSIVNFQLCLCGVNDRWRRWRRYLFFLDVGPAERSGT